MADSNSATVTPLEGMTTVDDKMTFEPERLSYVAAERIAASIADEIHTKVANQTVVIAGDALLADLGNLAATVIQLDMLASEYQGVAALGDAGQGIAPLDASPEALSMVAVPAIAAITAGLQGALGVVSLLRENVEFHGITTRIDSRAFEVALAGHLKQRGASRVFVPDLLAVSSFQTDPGSLSARWRAVKDARQMAWRVAGPLIADLARKDADLDIAGRLGTAAEVARLSREVFQLRRDIEPLTETLGHADRRLADLQGQWDKVSETTGLSMLARLLRAEVIAAMNPIYMHAAVISSGGHNRVSRSLWRMFLFGDGLSSMGGIVARWALLASDGSIVQGGIRANRQGARFPRVPIDDGSGA